MAKVTKLEEAKEKKFVAACGDMFDPAPGSSCHQDCKKDTPENFKACEEHFKKMAEAPNSRKAKAKKVKDKVVKQKNCFGSLCSAMGTCVDQMLSEGCSVQEVVEELGMKEVSVRNRIKWLKERHNVSTVQNPVTKEWFYEEKRFLHKDIRKADWSPKPLKEGEKAPKLEDVLAERLAKFLEPFAGWKPSGRVKKALTANRKTSKQPEASA